MNLGDSVFFPRRASASRRASRRREEIETRHNRPGQRLVAASNLLGDRIVDGDNRTLGTLCDVLIDAERGCIAYAVMASGGFMGLGERMYAIPWKALSRDGGRRCYVLCGSQATLAGAPVFDREHWPSEPDLQWHERVHRYYKATPYWV
jgi:sporulation protein YlmC with PRC-barrel domain